MWCGVLKATLSKLHTWNKRTKNGHCNEANAYKTHTVVLRGARAACGSAVCHQINGDVQAHLRNRARLHRSC